MRTNFGRVFVLVLALLLGPSYSHATNRNGAGFGIARISDGRGSISYPGARVRPGDRFIIVVLDTDGRSRFIRAQVENALDECPELKSAMIEGPYYSIRILDPQESGFVVGIVAPASKFSIGRPNRVPSLIGKDGAKVYFRFCTGTESVHYSAWSGPKQSSRRIWREYYYLGYDVEPSCTEKEVR